ncbi:MAG TPA: hypothetical protein VMR34_05365 [Candidatus Saccharimonadales bacterium]|nr:hypothetical protein [Candidatus Saccharimonadales bacterium]
MSTNEYRITSIGYREIYGSQGMSLDEIRKALKDYDLNGLLEFSTKLGIILFHTSGGPKNLNLGQRNIIRSLYDNKEERDAFVKLLSKAVVRNEATDSWGLFSKHSALLFLKLALESCPTKGGKLISPELTPEIAKILLSLTDYIDANYFTPSTLVVPADYSRIKIREFMFRRLVFTVEEKFPNPLYRHLKIINYLAAHHSDFGFSKYFKEATGLSLKLYYDIGTMLSMRWGIKKEDFNLDQDWYIDKRTHFKEVKVTQANLEKLYKLLTFSPKDFAAIYSWSLGVLSNKDIYDYNYLFLRKFPLVEVADHLLAAPSPEYLVSKTTEGAYMIVSDYLRDKGLTKQYNLLPSLWGEAFEHYADTSLKKILGAGYRRVAEDKSKRADGIYEGKQSILLFEEKSIHLSYKATVTGNEQDLATPFGQCFGKKKGIVQAVSHAKDIIDGKFVLKESIGKRKILPILIVSDYLPAEAFHYMFYQKMLRANGVKFNEPYLLPFIYITIEEVEFLEAMATEMTKDDIEQLLIDYSQKVSKADINNDFSFKNHLYSQGIKIPLNKSLMSDFEKHTKRLMKSYFKHDQT